MTQKEISEIKDYSVIEVDINDLKSDQSNPNVMTLEQMRGLEKSIMNFGRLAFIVVDQNLNVIDGAHRIEVEKAVGTEKVKVLQVQVKDDIEKKMMRETLNKLHGEYDKQKESSELLAIFEDNRLDEIAELLAQPKQDLEKLISKYNPQIKFEREEDSDRLPSLFDTNAFVKSGEIWKLGRHILMCGDSTENDNLDRLMNGKKADLVFTDPPYAIFGSSTGFVKNKDDNMIRPFFRSLLRACKYVTNYAAHIYIFCNWRTYPTLELENRSVKLVPKNLIVWYKPNVQLGVVYQSQHEFIFVLAHEEELNFHTQKSDSKVRKVVDSNVWTLGVDTGAIREHHAEKPIKLMERAIKNSSESNDLVCDLFLGSGSTLIACEQTNRICYGMEIDEHYCSVIIKRWELYTGQKAEKIV